MMFVVMMFVLGGCGEATSEAMWKDLKAVADGQNRIQMDGDGDRTLIITDRATGSQWAIIGVHKNDVRASMVVIDLGTIRNNPKPILEVK